MAQARYARAIAATASSRERPTVARPSTPASSFLARTEMLRCNPSVPVMCLYSDGRRTPRRSARAARVRLEKPTSSAMRSPSSTTRASESPALGTLANLVQKLQYSGRGDIGLLRLRIVAGLGHHED